jgi:hypothetical protein
MRMIPRASVVSFEEGTMLTLFYLQLREASSQMSVVDHLRLRIILAAVSQMGDYSPLVIHTQ